MSHIATPTHRSVLTLSGSVAAARPAWTTLLAAAGTLHAASHGAVAWTAAMLGRSIAGSASPPFTPPFPLPYNNLAALPHGGFAIAIASAGLAAVLAKGVFGILASLAQARLSAATSQTLRDQTINSLLRSGANAPSPATIARLVSRLREVESAVANGPFSVARAIAQLLPIAAGLVLLSPILALLAIGVLAPFSVALSRARRRWRHTHDASMQAADIVHEEMDDLIRHLDLWRVCGSGSQVRTTLHRLGLQSASTHVRAQTIGVAISSANEVLGAAALLAVLVVAALGLADIDGAAVIAFVTLFFLAYRPLRDLGDARTAWLRGHEALQTLAGLASPNMRSASAESVPGVPSLHAAKVKVENLQVSGQSPPISFEFSPGEMVAITGPTGSGKTSLLRALLGLEPTALGAVYVNGELLVPGQVGPSYRPFAWVPQDAPVVSGSLDDNLRIGGGDPGRAREQLASLGASKLAAELGESKLGASGRPLSGGEKRWVSIARALATGLPVLLLDEPTVGLDTQARVAVLELLARAKGKRGLIVASHDRDVVVLADRVVDLG